MRILRTNVPLDPDRLKAGMRSAKTAAEFRRWHILYMVSVYKVTAGYLSDTTGYSKASIYNTVQQPEKEIHSKIRGGRKRELMDIQEENQMMQKFETMAMQGRIVSSRNIKNAVEAIAGRSVSDDYIWDLFKRNGWRKHLPGPNQYNALTHPKKRPRTIWLPLRIILENISKQAIQ